MKSFKDGYVNLGKKIGTRDGSMNGTGWVYLPMQEQELGRIYDTNSLVNLVVDAPVKDAFLTGITSENEAVVELFESVSDTIKKAISMSRAYGGALILFHDGREIVLTPEDVFSSEVELNPLREDFLLPKNVKLVGSSEELDTENIYFAIQSATNTYKRENNGIGVSIIEKVNDSIKRYSIGLSLAVDILGELNQNVVKMHDLNSVLSDDGEQDVIERLDVMNKLKSNNSILLLDGEDEYINVTKSLSGVRDVIVECSINVCASSKIPYTRLFGKSQSGLNSDNKGDLINYYDTVVSDIREDFVRPIFNRILESRGMMAQWEFEDIYQDTPLEKVEVQGIKVANVEKMLAMGLIGEDKAKEMLGL